MLDFLRFDPRRCAFPSPALPLLPPPASLTWRRRSSVPRGALPGPARHFQHFARGRYALREALLAAGVRAGETVLAPSYHCRTMLDPILALGAKVGLYGLLDDLAPDLAAVEDARLKSASRVRALVATHFFGFARDLSALVAWCRQHDIELIEDCAHGMVLDPADGHSGAAARDMGIAGRIGISSPYKFVPSADGGLLWTDHGRDTVGARSSTPPWDEELRGMLDLWRRWRSASTPPQLPSSSGDGSDLEVPCGETVAEQSADPSVHYDRRFESRDRLRCSRWMVRHMDIDAIAQARRTRYLQWSQATETFRGATSFASLDARTVPYMFPLRLTQAEPAFTLLKRAGVPIRRWDDMAVSGCQVASGLREHLLHLPCHQGLSDAGMEWMTTTVRRTLESCR